MNNLILVSIIMVAFSATCTSPQAAEKDYVNQYCEGITEYRLKDNTRVDCLTDDVAQEFDYSYKWAEAIGQSLYYGHMTNRYPSIVLIMKGRSAHKHLKRLQETIKAYDLPIEVTTVPY